MLRLVELTLEQDRESPLEAIKHGMRLSDLCLEMNRTTQQERGVVYDAAIVSKSSTQQNDADK